MTPEPDAPAGWEIKPALSLVESIRPTAKVKSKEYQDSGSIPIVDQGKSLIAGYVDDESLRQQTVLPVIVFGDHTREWKFIDFPFAPGADGTKLLRPLPIHDPRFVYYAFVATPLRNLGYSRHFKLLKEAQVLVPPLPEQRKIAAILYSLDEVIEKTEVVIEHLQVVKKAMMQELLTRGLPGRHTRFKQTEIGDIPEEWEVVAFREVCTKIVDGVHKKPEYVAIGVPFVTVKNLTAGPGISFDSLNYVTQSDHEEFIKRTHPEVGDVLLSKDGTLGVPRVVETSEPFSIFVSVALLKPQRDLIDTYFLRYALEAPPVADQFFLNKSGSAIKHIHLVDLRKTLCPLPPITEQVEIAARLRELESRLFAEQVLVDAVSKVKSALMSVLLTGELRITPDEEAA